METPLGAAYRRCNGDGYGEHEDGSPFDGIGIGRARPLQASERGHFDRMLGRDPLPYLATMARMTGPGGLIPEQVWDGPAIPARGLEPGKPTGSAMPLVWAHAEYVKLRRSLRDGTVFDMPSQTVQRYQVQQVRSPFTVWRFNHKRRIMMADTTLRIELWTPATVHWSTDGWRTVQDVETRDTGLGIYVADLATAALASETAIV